MDLFKVSATLEEAVKKGLVAIRDIAGRGSWKGMDITLENRTMFKGLDVHIPAGTLFKERSGKYQQMMTVNSASVFIPARGRVTKPLDDTICTQPRVPAPPPRTIPINDLMREAAAMSDEEFERRLKREVQIGRRTEQEAEGLRRTRPAFMRDTTLMAAIKAGKSEATYDYAYLAVAPSSISPEDMAEAHLGMGINLFMNGLRRQAVSMFEKAAKVVPPSMSSYYGKIHRFANTFCDQSGEEVNRVLWASCGTTAEREVAELLMDEALSSPSEDIKTLPKRAIRRFLARKLGEGEEDAEGIKTRIHYHHLYPRQYRDFFEDLGIDIDRWTVAVDEATHQKFIHNEAEWNRLWGAWINEHRGEVDAEEVLAFGRRLLTHFGLEGLWEGDANPIPSYDLPSDFGGSGTPPIVPTTR